MNHVLNKKFEVFLVVQVYKIFILYREENRQRYDLIFGIYAEVCVEKGHRCHMRKCLAYVPALLMNSLCSLGEAGSQRTNHRSKLLARLRRLKPGQVVGSRIFRTVWRENPSQSRTKPGCQMINSLINFSEKYSFLLFLQLVSFL